MPVIGREYPADIIVSAPQVSARHATIEHVRDDLYALKDLGSSNGTWVNEARVESALVRRGDRVRLGSFEVDWWSLVATVPQRSMSYPEREPGAVASGAAAGRRRNLPPDLHWALLALFSIVSLGVFATVWWVRQTQWAWRQDPSSKATLLAALAVGVGPILVLITFLLSGVSLLTLGVFQSLSTLGALLLVFPVAFLASAGFNIAAAFDVRRVMVHTCTDSLGQPLFLSGVMTFFFPNLYLQYHMSRIAAERHWMRE